MPAVHHRLPSAPLVGHIVAYVVASAAFSFVLSPEIGVSQRVVTFAVCFAVFYSQQLLLFIWAGLGTGWWLPRLAIVFLLACGIWGSPGMLLLYGQSPRGLVSLAGATAVLMMCVVIPLAIVQLRGYQLRCFPRDELPQGTAFQTSIRGLLAVTLFVAVMLAFEQSVEFNGEIQNGATFSCIAPLDASFSSSDIIAFARYATITGTWLQLAAAATLGVWTCLSAGTVLSRMIVSVLVLVGVAAFLPYVFHGDAITYFFWGFPPLASFLIVSLTLLPFRAAGYRFLRSPISESEGAQSHPTVLRTD